MAIRTYYWDPVADGRARTLLHRGPARFRRGNVGDLFNLDLLAWALPDEPVDRVLDAGSRLLLVGSVAHRLHDGDLLNGIGCKTPSVPTADQVRVRVRGVRGPRTLDILRAAGHDVSDVRFQGDPGLLIGRVHPDLLTVDSEPGRVVFVPHFRERGRVRSTRRVRVVDVDATPHEVGVEIRRAELVLASSLHGLVFAHGLGRPAVPVAPSGGASRLKYEDHLLALGQPVTCAADLDEALRGPSPTSPVDVTAAIDAISLPTTAELAAAGALV